MDRLRIVAAVGALAGLLIPIAAAVPANAAPAGRDGKTRPVIMVHGWDMDATTDCDAAWGPAKRRLARDGFTGGLYTYGYYKGDSNCSMKNSGSTDTPIMRAGRAFAWQIYKNFSRKGRPVDILAHSMGGLVTKAALTGVAHYGQTSKGWPPYLYVEDVVTLGTPHKGLGSKGPNCAKSRQCANDMQPGSFFLGWVDDEPQSRMRTEYTFMASTGDKVVPWRSGLNNGRSKHMILYRETKGRLIGHSQMRTTTSGLWNVTVRNKPAAKYHTVLGSPIGYAGVSLADN